MSAGKMLERLCTDINAKETYSSVERDLEDINEHARVDSPMNMWTEPSPHSLSSHSQVHRQRERETYTQHTATTTNGGARQVHAGSVTGPTRFRLQHRDGGSLSHSSGN